MSTARAMHDARALAAVRELLAELRLDAYLFEIEHTPGAFLVHLRYATQRGWKEKTLQAPAARLLATSTYRFARRAVAEVWRAELGDARLAPSVRIQPIRKSSSTTFEPPTDRVAADS